MTTMRKPRPKPTRTARLLIAPEPGRPAAVELTVGKRSDAYLVTEIRTDQGGRAFSTAKAGSGETYHVRIDGTRGSCECKGFLHHGHCKHVAGLAALIAADFTREDVEAFVARWTRLLHWIDSAPRG